MPATNEIRSPWTVFLIFLRLGLTSFGGPVAHIGFFRTEFVERRRWLSEHDYADLVALCQFLPGPASSQVGMALGLTQAGYRGALAAWCGFTLPSALALIALALGLVSLGDTLPNGLLHGLKIAAVAVVAQAVWAMQKSLCPDAPRRVLGLLAAASALLFPAALTSPVIIVLAGLAGLALFRPSTERPATPLLVPIGQRAAIAWLALFGILLIGLPILAQSIENPALARFDAFYRAGSLVFGGGHVVLPLLQAEVVQPGWIDDNLFLAGYGAAQAVPGPLFTFAAFLGAAMGTAPQGVWGGLLCLLAIFTPSFLIIAGALPFWIRLRGNVSAQAALAGINAAVVGLLLAAFITPVWTSAIHQPRDLGLALLALLAGTRLKCPPWCVVAASALAGVLLAQAMA